MGNFETKNTSNISQFRIFAVIRSIPQSFNAKILAKSLKISPLHNSSLNPPEFFRPKKCHPISTLTNNLNPQYLSKVSRPNTLPISPTPPQPYQSLIVAITF
jgi:hypothetical protein